jgi:hypothetical protein
MPSDTHPDPTLETDDLDQLLESPAPSAPVVVVQYRNRGVPSWLFFPFVIVVTGVALFLYHRMVVERYRVQAAQDRSDLALKIETERALQPLVRDSQPSTTVLPDPDKGTAVAGTGDSPGLSVSPSPMLTLPGATETGVGEPAPSTPPGKIGQSGPLPRISVPAATSDRAGPPLPLQSAGLTTRSILPNPFAEGTSPPEPPGPSDSTGSRAAIGNAAETLPAQTGGLAEKSAPGAIRGHEPAITPDNQRKDMAARGSSEMAAATRAPGEEHRAGGPDPGPQGAAGDGRIGPQPLPALPTKEENQRQIEEEAAKLDAENAARIENRIDDLRSRRFEEQLKFRQELREVIQAKGNLAGPDIANLDKRYGYEGDRDTILRAYHTWHFVRMSERKKVEHVRSLELPETVILEFMCATIHATIGQRNGPRDENEVRVRAALRLLQYDLPKPGAGRRPVTGAGVGASPTSKSVVSTPR